MMEKFIGDLVIAKLAPAGDGAYPDFKVGILIAVYPERDEVTITFGNLIHETCNRHDIYILNHSGQLYRDMLANVKNIATADFKKLFRIVLLQQSHLKDDRVKAMELASASETTRFFSLISISENLRYAASRNVMEFSETID